MNAPQTTAPAPASGVGPARPRRPKAVSVYLAEATPQWLRLGAEAAGYWWCCHLSHRGTGSPGVGHADSITEANDQARMHLAIIHAGATFDAALEADGE